MKIGFAIVPVRADRAVQRPNRALSLLIVRISGLLLVITALLFGVCNSWFSSLRMETLSVILLSITLVCAICVGRTEEGITSIIGLFFLTTLVFNIGRPLIWLILQDDRIYDLTFGVNLTSPDYVKSGLLTFWCIAIAGFYGGYFLLYRDVGAPVSQLSPSSRVRCRQIFWLTALVIALLLPPELINHLRTFSAGGYSALYAGQTSYSFSFFRLADFILPVLFALAVFLRERKYDRALAIVISFYVLSGLVVGQRAAAGEWVLTWIWYLSAVRKQKINRALLVACGSFVVIVFQFLAVWREGGSASITLVEFFIEQGITFLLPELIQQFPRLPIHTVLASWFPLGAVYSAFHIGTAETQSLGNYLSSQLNMSRFEGGGGLGGNFYLEIYYAAFGMSVVFAICCIIGGLLLRHWENRTAEDRWPFFLLCMCAPSIIFLPRGTISGVTSEIIYGSLYVCFAYLITRLLAIAAKAQHSSPSKGQVNSAPG